MRKTILMLLAAWMLLCVVGCGSQPPAETKLEVLEKLFEIPDLGDMDDTGRALYNLARGEGEISKKYPELVTDAAAVKEYIEKHSVEGYLDFMIRVNNLRHSNMVFYEHLIEAEQGKLLDVAANYQTYGSYYKDNPTAEPQPYEESQTEGFNNPNKGNEVYYDTKTDTREVLYYGDFAIAYGVNWHYDKGRYEWVGGKFYDELPSWKMESYRGVYCRGNYLGEADSILDEEKKAQMYVTDKWIYLLLKANKSKIEVNRYALSN